MNSFDILNEIKRQADTSQDRIVLGVYRFMLLKHNDLCGCDYCKLLSHYIYLRKVESKAKSIYTRYDFYDEDYRMKSHIRYWNAKELADKQKKIKDELKQKAI